MSKLNWDKAAIEQRVLTHGAEAYSSESNQVGYSSPANNFIPKVHPCPNCGAHVAAALLKQHRLIDCPKLRKHRAKIPCKVCGKMVTAVGYRQHFRVAHGSSSSNSSPSKRAKNQVEKSTKQSNEQGSQNVKLQLKSVSKNKSDKMESSDTQPFNGIRFNS